MELKRRGHRKAKVKLRRGWVSLSLRDFIADALLILCGAKDNRNGRENQIRSGQGCRETVIVYLPGSQGDQRVLKQFCF